MDDNLLPILKEIKKLNEELHALKKLSHLQMAQIRGLNTYCAARLSVLCRHGQAIEVDLIDRAVKTAYDEVISSLREEDVGYATRMDMRGDLPSGERLDWYTSHKYPPTLPE